ncbi:MULTISPECIES: hypothetical protein [unclassified Rhodococcus (in: high G+C Gram-positive bacteria)]|uniref:hypothetical protein n=1 Tax=unclassified Rhodococcus (in: high G+C Gram-positive bacteria) TaxID=192944 RepID=UPI0011ED5BC8|nr:MULTISPECIES: hypothetical protein [unclassified Rhodococcus (in: high G+C Gram-positive bacteria)]KAA0923155.1 hypothetical protein FQ188_18810 [Rhodococcus sp. ANT_H53B]MDI9927674.1 hypothetical protein [Rhodococcus sp. IEGM 1341]
MPPQRRKIVPPTTTSKVRRKVAGTGKPTAADTDTASTDAEGSAAAESQAVTTPTEPVLDKPATDKPVTEKPSLAKSSVDKPATDKSATEKPSVDKPATDKSATEKPSVDKPAADSIASASSSAPVSGIGYKHVIVVAVIAVVLGAFAAVAAFKPFATIDNAAWVDSAATQEVTSAATDALQTLYTYKAETIDADFDAARAVLNQSMLDEFNSTAETTKSAVVQTSTGTEAMVTDIGVTRLEDDKAELLANVNISATQNGVASGSAEGPLTVNMEKVDGSWKLSAIDDQ